VREGYARSRIILSLGLLQFLMALDIRG
jgi:hypothetical protein